MKIYQVECEHWETNDPIRNPEFYAGKTEASKAARAAATETGELVEVYEVEIKPGKAGIVALANDAGWVLDREIVYTAKPRKGGVARCEPLSADDDIDELM